jgi:hypothetical protein
LGRGKVPVKQPDADEFEAIRQVGGNPRREADTDGAATYGSETEDGGGREPGGNAGFYGQPGRAEIHKIPAEKAATTTATD